MPATPGPFVTVVTGTAVFVLGQIALKIVIEPYLELQKVIGRIAYSIVHYSNVFSSVPRAELSEEKQKRIDEAILEYRGLASQLASLHNFIRGYWFWRYFLCAPSKTDMNEACKALIALSNSLYVKPGFEGRRHELQAEIKSHLSIVTIRYD